jgi:hypothetical protein
MFIELQNEYQKVTQKSIFDLHPIQLSAYLDAVWETWRVLPSLNRPNDVLKSSGTKPVRGPSGLRHRHVDLGSGPLSSCQDRPRAAPQDRASDPKVCTRCWCSRSPGRCCPTWPRARCRSAASVLRDHAAAARDLGGRRRRLGQRRVPEPLVRSPLERADGAAPQEPDVADQVGSWPIA